MSAADTSPACGVMIASPCSRSRSTNSGAMPRVAEYLRLDNEISRLSEQEERLRNLQGDLRQKLAEAKKLYERVGSRRKYIKIFTADEGGAEHCQVDHRQLGVDYIGDWLLANM